MKPPVISSSYAFIYQPLSFLVCSLLAAVTFSCVTPIPSHPIQHNGFHFILFSVSLLSYHVYCSCIPCICGDVVVNSENKVKAGESSSRSAGLASGGQPLPSCPLRKTVLRVCERITTQIRSNFQSPDGRTNSNHHQQRGISP